MKNIHKVSILAVVVMALAVVGLLAGCSGGENADLDAARAQVDKLQKELSTLQSRFDAASYDTDWYIHEQNILNTMQNRLNVASTAQSQTEANKDLVRRYYNALSNGDNNILTQIFATDFKQYVSAAAPPLDIDAKAKRLAGFNAAAPDGQITVNNMTAEGDQVAAIFTFRGTHQGSFLGIPPTGKPFTVTAIEVFHIENGKVVEQWGGPDIFDLLQQIGVVISAGKSPQVSSPPTYEEFDPWSWQ